MKIKKIKKYRKGFSIIEMVAVTAIVAVIALVVTSMLVSGLKTYRLKRQVVDEDERIALVIRKFEQTTRAANKLETVSSNQLVFYRYFDSNSSSPTRVRFFVDGNQLKIGLTQPEGTEPNVTYSSPEQIDLSISDITNPDQLFEYYDSNNNLLTDNVELSSVKMIRLTISIDKNGSSPPGPSTGTTKVMLRNMKINL